MNDLDQERDRLFDHEYDGIREYDNPMPRWWVYIFVLSFLVSFPYILYYHFGSGPSVHDNLDSELQAYASMILETYGDLQPDEATLVRYMHDDMAMTGMAGLFKSKCAQCHLADGSGSVGPNLTDERWINVKTITDIPTLLNTGVITKGMPAWGEQLSQTQIVLLSSYVAHLRQQPLAGKEAQGDPIDPWPESLPEPATESGG